MSRPFLSWSHRGCRRRRAGDPHRGRRSGRADGRVRCDHACAVDGGARM